MTIHVSPDIDIPLPDAAAKIDATIRISGAAETTKMLADHGLEIEITSEDKEVAAQVALGYAEDPTTAVKKLTTKKAAMMTPASLLLTDRILKDFGHSIVKSAAQVRHMVTNKLIQETESDDARIRIRALELLGKISAVGLFSDKTEVTVTHQTTDDIRDRLRDKLTKLVEPEEEIEDAIIIDVDAELGIKDEG